MIGKPCKTFTDRLKRLIRRKHDWLLFTLLSFNLLNRKIGKYGIGFRSCYHVRLILSALCVLLNNLSIMIGHRHAPHSLWLAPCDSGP